MRDITQPHDSKSQLEDLKGSSDPKGHERHGKIHNHRLSNGTARKRHITQQHDCKTQLEDLKGLPDPKGQERYRKMPQSQKKPRHREEETYNTYTHTTVKHN